MRRIRKIVNTGLLQIFLALLLVALLMFVSNYMVYKNSINGVYDQVSQNNKLVMKNMIGKFDESFKEIYNLNAAIQMLPYNAWESTADGGVDMHDAYMIHKYLLSLIPPIDYIEDVIVHHRGSNLVVTPAGTIDFRELFRQQYVHPTYTVDYWQSLTAAKHPLRVLPSQDYTRTIGSDTIQRRLIPVVANNESSSLNILVLLNADKLLRHVNQDAMMQGTSLIVMDDNRNIILNTDKSWDIVDMLRELNPGAGSTETTVKNKDYEYNLFQSNYNGFLYINKSPYKFKDLDAVTAVNRQIMAVAIASATILSALLSLYLYKPVRHIVRLIGSREEHGADYGRIRTGIVRIQAENASIKTQLDAYSAQLRQAAILSALHGSAPARETEQRLQQFVPELYASSRFVLVAFRLHAAAESGQFEAGALDETFGSLEAELLRHVPQAFMLQTGERTCLGVIGLGRSAQREDAVHGLREMLGQRQASETDTGVWNAAVSRSYSSEANHYRQAYREVIDALDYRNMDSRDPVIDCLAIRPTWKVYAPLDEIEKLSKLVMIGNAEEALRIVEEIVQGNEAWSVHRHQLVSVAKTCFYEMLRQLEASDLEPKQLIALEQDFLRSLQTAASSEDIQELLVRAVRFMAEACSRAVPKSKLDRASIVHYIEQHYMEDLHLEHMAGILETTPKYFSNYFKKTFGVNFVEYVNKVRLSHAKDLLKSTELSVAEIGKLAGYDSSSRFTNTFRKYYGVAPSEYRKSSQPEQPAAGRKKS
ncbi:AraC-type DNA-binding protein [Paenibacillus sp. UNCCL117]|uniref:helix-turn-helix domain-containing protein n=1 Tax=unclassified Paenibacillus TaxID=185978 RepID=UPI0008898EA9|nr:MULTISPECIES: AraC family transcriptional regulator [unclassified Paenibacillus]SDD11561.1 AraC-type DNA-binding protein [Paenibacillus sp. cl123]SFW33600.1 AraC-type DNA-binding protein [Paenibacillus sp. UNCCL117]